MSWCIVFKPCLVMIFYILTKRAEAQLPTLDEAPMNATGVVGSSVTFECTVRNKHSYNVIWVKRPEDGTLTYISRNWDVFGNNPKYVVHNDENEPSFPLEIFNLEMSDAATYECRYEHTSPPTNELLGSAILTVVSVEPSPSCQYVSVPSLNQTVCDLHCVWSPAAGNPPAEIFKNGQLVPIDFQLSDRVISRQALANLYQLNDFECRWTSLTTGQINTCRYQQSAQAPIILGVDPFVNGVAVGQTARFECQAEHVFTSFSSQEITYTWSITKDGQVIDLGERQKGLMKQAMRILSVEHADDGVIVMCTARSVDGVAHGAGSLSVYLPTSASTQPTSKSKSITTRYTTTSVAPRKNEPLMNSTILTIIAVLLFLIIVLCVVIIVLAKSKTRRDKWIALGRSMSSRRKRSKRDNRQDKAHLGGDQEMIFADTNPDIIRAHSTLPPIYAMPDKSRKSNTMDGGARYPPRHYTPRRQSYGGPEFRETEFAVQTSDMKPGLYSNPYEDIDNDAVNDAKQMRGKSHTVSHYYQDSALTGSPRRYRGYGGMKSAGSASMLYGKPEKPQRNQKGLSLKSRKSWDQPGSIENLCNYAVSDTRSVKSFTGSVCDGDSYACVDDVEGGTVVSDYMDMNAVLSDSTLDDMNDITRESELSGYDEPPLYAQITK
nr:uncharacterized protein LOC129260445 [Lytechinus pictus]